MIVKGLLWAIATLFLYLLGLFLVAGNVDISNVLAEFAALDTTLFLQSDQMIALVFVTLVVLALSPILQQVIRLNRWLGILTLVVSLTTSLLLATGVLTFEDRRLLVITSALLGSFVLSFTPLSLVALIGVRNEKRRLEKLSHLQKLHIQEPRKLLFQSTKQSLSPYASITFLITYSGFLYLYSKYLDVALREVVTTSLYSLSFLVAICLYVVGYVRSVKRFLQ